MSSRTFSATRTGLMLMAVSLSIASTAHAEGNLPTIRPNDNRRPAGRLDDGALTLHLRAAMGLLRPEGEAGPALEVESFGEEGGPLETPAPLIRVTEGTAIDASVRNDLDVPLTIHGLCAHDGNPCQPLAVPPGERREVRFSPGSAGTYHYWATTSGRPLQFRVADAQLSGAFVVDPPAASIDDRVLVITDWTSLTPDQIQRIINADDLGAAFNAINPKFTFLVNGMAWPSTERMTYQLGEQVHWRVVNLSTQPHPMHLHGFYFEVERFGDGLREKSFDPEDRQKVVTQLLMPGNTMALSWTAERVGNWLFHCHISEHVSPKRRLTSTQEHGDGHHAAHGGSDAMGGMAGLILGVTITAAGVPAHETLAAPARQLTLEMQAGARQPGRDPAYGFALTEGSPETGATGFSSPGPTLTLRRGEPVEITLINKLSESTAIHWHGMELDSYYDGVHGWSGIGTQVTPIIEPGESFTVRFAPPRAGTFIYHTHLHGGRQLTSGMYGALVVVDRDDEFNPEVDHVIVIGRSTVESAAASMEVGAPGQESASTVVINGRNKPLLVWKAGARHRIRFVNITPDDVFVASLAAAEAPVTWRPVAKDGARVPPSRSVAGPAAHTIAVGETYDFEYDAPPGRRALWINVRTPAGKWEAQAQVVIK